MSKKFEFLVKNWGNKNFVHAVKFDQYPWHYFEEVDTILSEHHSLPRGLNHLIESCKEMRAIELYLNDEQVKSYYQNGRFIFKNTHLKTFEEITRKLADNRTTKRKVNRLRDLTFHSGETNPLLFLAEFEKCIDIKSDQDKMQKLRNFVDEEHKPEFSELQFTSDWLNTKNKFIIKYSLPFIENKKKHLKIEFGESSSLRSFVNQKFCGFAKYTTMPVINQMEMILNELPAEVDHLFMVNEKFDCEKQDILDFCDSIEDVVANSIQGRQDRQDTEPIQEPLNRMEVFKYDPNDTDVSDETIINRPSTSRGTGRIVVTGRGNGRIDGKGRIVKPVVSQASSSFGIGRIVKRGRPRKIPSETDVDMNEYDYLDQTSTTSKSSWSSGN